MVGTGLERCRSHDGRRARRTRDRPRAKARARTRTKAEAEACIETEADVETNKNGARKPVANIRVVQEAASTVHTVQESLEIQEVELMDGQRGVPLFQKVPNPAKVSQLQFANNVGDILVVATSHQILVARKIQKRVTSLLPHFSQVRFVVNSADPAGVGLWEDRGSPTVSGRRSPWSGQSEVHSRHKAAHLLRIVSEHQELWRLPLNFLIGQWTL